MAPSPWAYTEEDAVEAIFPQSAISAGSKRCFAEPSCRPPTTSY
jgi:hypothetical protein